MQRGKCYQCASDDQTIKNQECRGARSRAGEVDNNDNRIKIVRSTKTNERLRACSGGFVLLLGSLFEEPCEQLIGEYRMTI